MIATLVLGTLIFGVTVFSNSFMTDYPHTPLIKVHHIGSAHSGVANHLGVVNEARQCGGNGKFIEWRRQTCEFSRRGPCVLQSEELTDGSVTLVPSRNSTFLSIQSTVLDKNGTVLETHERKILPDSEVTAGKEYVHTAVVSFSKVLKGQIVTVQLNFFRNEEKQVELCAQGNFMIL